MSGLFECMDIVDKIYDYGGVDSVKNFLALILKEFPEAEEMLMDGEINGKKIRDIINDKD